MTERIHIVVEREEKQRFRRVAARQGKSLSEWLREAAREKLADAEAGTGPSTPEELRAFFAALDEQEPGPEPDWGTHLDVIEGSIARGRSGT